MTRLRLAELIASLSLATDLARGQPMEHGLRTCLVAVALAEAAGVPERDRAHVYYVALLRWVGCTGHAHEVSTRFGDDLAFHARAATFDLGSLRDPVFDAVRHAGRGHPTPRRLRAVAAAVAASRRMVPQWFRAGFEVAERLADRLGLDSEVQHGLGHAFERWDGRGPVGLEGEEIGLAARIVHVAEDAEVHHRVGGLEAAMDVVRDRAGSAYDPAVARLFLAEAPAMLGDATAPSAWDAVLAAEPGARPAVPASRVEAALTAVADFVDLKSPYTLGHSRGVADLAAAAGAGAGVPESDETLLRRAGLLHDLGRVGVANSIWDKRGPLGDAEWERVRLHPHLTERVLGRAEALEPLGALAGLHHERLDGSGYHRGATAPALPPAARILAAADAYHAMTELRPHRPRLGPGAAAEALRREAGAGRLDGAAVEAVVGASGHRDRRPRAWPAGLTAREVEVLRLAARGLSERQMARRLVISERTVQHHVQNIYGKIDVSTRAAATLFALQHGLLESPVAATKPI